MLNYKLLSTLIIIKKETLIKYLEFLKIETKRHQNDAVITDNQLDKLAIIIPMAQFNWWFKC